MPSKSHNAPSLVHLLVTLDYLDGPPGWATCPLAIQAHARRQQRRTHPPRYALMSTNKRVVSTPALPPLYTSYGTRLIVPLRGDDVFSALAEVMNDV